MTKRILGNEADPVKFAVFRDRLGNRFVFPGIHEKRNRHIDPAECAVMEMALNISKEPDLLTVERDDDMSLMFEHIRSEVLHINFKHGAATVYLIGGPEFEAAKAGVQ